MLLALQTLKFNSGLLRTFNKTQLIVVAYAAFPCCFQFARELKDLRVKERLKRLVLRWGVPVWSFTHYKERNLTHSNLSCSNRHSLVFPEACKWPQFISAQINRIQHFFWRRKGYNPLLTLFMQNRRAFF